MIDVVIGGRLRAPPQRRLTRQGKAYATAQMMASAHDSELPIYCGLICFQPEAVAALLALSAGDPLAVVGEATPKVYQPADGGEPRASLNVLVHVVTSPYAVRRKRQVLVDADGQEASAEREDARA